MRHDNKLISKVKTADGSFIYFTTWTNRLEIQKENGEMIVVIPTSALMSARLAQTFFNISTRLGRLAGGAE